ncbi:MAG: LPS export ABC transporter permease LptG [Paracoccaceae bacterium]
MTLFLYLAKQYFWRFASVSAVFFGIMVLAEATTLLGKFGTSSLGVLDLMRMALLWAPNGVYQILPFIAVLASLALFLGLSRSSELVATRAAGQSALRILAAPVAAAFVIGLIGVTAINPFAAATLGKFESETGRYKSGSLSSFSLSRKGLWLRQGSAGKQTVIFAESANFAATRLSGVTFFEFSGRGTIRRRIDAQFAILRAGRWDLGPGKFWELYGSGDVPDKSATAFDSLSIASDLTSGQILDSFGDPATISFWDTPDFVSRLEASGLATEKHRVHFQIELASPLMLVAMVLLGAALTMRHNRARGRGTMILITVILGLSAYILRDLAEIMGSNGAIPVLAAAWVPPVAMTLLALGLVLHMEDG